LDVFRDGSAGLSGGAFGSAPTLSVASSDDTLVSSNLSYNIETPLYEGIAVTTNKMKYSL
jgi:hypothetical protein